MSASPSSESGSSTPTSTTAAAPTTALPSTDPLSAFRISYAKRLSQLTWTDKKLITSLTILADEHRDKSGEVLKAIEERMRELPTGDHRLPVFYLIDSLVQNLGPKGADYPKRFSGVIAPMIQSAVKRANKKVQGSMYRMWNQWKKKKAFATPTIEQIEQVLNHYLTVEERTEALNRPSLTEGGAGGGDPRKRPAAVPSSTTKPDVDQPATKKMTLQDPRLRPSPSPAPPAGPPPELQTLLAILETPDIKSRTDLTSLVDMIRRDVAQPLPYEQLKLVIAAAVEQLQKVLMAPSPTVILPPLPPLPNQAYLPPIPIVTQPIPTTVWTPPPAPVAPVVPSNLAMFASSHVQKPPRTARQMAQEEAQDEALASLEITFSDIDLKTPHPGLADTLYHKIPFHCKTCGRRIHNQEDMAQHLDWHFKMNKRNALIASQSSGIKSQQYYWEEWEWIAAEDVIFGVQKRTGVAGGSSGANEPGEQKESEQEKIARESVPATEQTRCPMCHDEFKKEWSDDSEEYMFRQAIRITPDLMTEVTAEITKLQQAAPVAPDITQADYNPVTAAAALTSQQTIAAASKEEDRLTQLYRYQRIAQHLRTYQGQILHRPCHFGQIQSLLKAKRPTQPSPSPSPIPADGPFTNMMNDGDVVMKTGDEPPALE